MMKLRCLFFALLGFLWSVAVYPDAAAIELVRYLGIQNVPEQDLQTLSQLKAAAEAPALTADQRKAAYLELFKLMARIQSSPVPEPVLQSLAGYAVTWYCDGQFGKEIAHTAKPGEFGAVIKRGHGAVP